MHDALGHPLPVELRHLLDQVVVLQQDGSLGARGQRELVAGDGDPGLTIGTAVGAPLAGVVIDRLAPGAGFLAVGAAGVVVAAGLLLALQLLAPRLRRPAGPPDPPGVPTAAPGVPGARV